MSAKFPIVSVVQNLLLTGRAHGVVYLKIFVMLIDCTTLVYTLLSHFFLINGILFIAPFSEGDKVFLSCL